MLNKKYRNKKFNKKYWCLIRMHCFQKKFAGQSHLPNSSKQPFRWKDVSGHLWFFLHFTYLTKRCACAIRYFKLFLVFSLPLICSGSYVHNTYTYLYIPLILSLSTCADLIDIFRTHFSLKGTVAGDIRPSGLFNELIPDGPLRITWWQTVENIVLKTSA